MISIPFSPAPLPFHVGPVFSVSLILLEIALIIASLAAQRPANRALDISITWLVV